VESVQVPFGPRQAAWRRLAKDLDAGVLDRVARVIGLDGVVDAAAELVAGRVRGRLVVDTSR
jgi:acrylyl-CoA reductase (NADPH)